MAAFGHGRPWMPIRSSSARGWLAAAISCQHERLFRYYNFVRIHQALRVTPAMAAGVTDRVWEVPDLAALLDSDRLEGKVARAGRKLAAKGPVPGF